MVVKIYGGDRLVVVRDGRFFHGLFAPYETFVYRAFEFLDRFAEVFGLAVGDEYRDIVFYKEQSRAEPFFERKGGAETFRYRFRLTAEPYAAKFPVAA